MITPTQSLSYGSLSTLDCALYLCSYFAAQLQCLFRHLTPFSLGADPIACSAGFQEPSPRRRVAAHIFQSHKAAEVEQRACPVLRQTKTPVRFIYERRKAKSGKDLNSTSKWWSVMVQLAVRNARTLAESEAALLEAAIVILRRDKRKET